MALPPPPKQDNILLSNEKVSLVCFRYAFPLVLTSLFIEPTCETFQTFIEEETAQHV